MVAVRLDGKVAVVTGATGGWGSGVAIGLADRGAAVVLNARTQSKLDAFASRLRRDGGRAIGVAQDVRTLDGATTLVERAVEEFGRVDVLVNCAGVTTTDGTAPKDAAEPQAALSLYGGSLLDLSEESWLYVLSAELTSVFNCTKAAATQMVRQGNGGAIVAVVGTILGAAGQSAHAAAKAGVLNGIWSWSDELVPHGITVNGVRGYVRSVLTDAAFDIETYDFRRRRETPTLPTEPIEAGELVAWLASDDASDVTGAYLGIDGARVTLWEPTLPGTAVFNHPSWTAEDLARDLGPIVRRRRPRASMTDVVIDMFSTHDLERAAKERAKFRAGS
jgi:NAD(P)-dependent dehydrogenase (short-subunit alcohol dehydrogenase family)